MKLDDRHDERELERLRQQPEKRPQKCGAVEMSTGYGWKMRRITARLSMVEMH